jgi:hypothetical protein
VTSFARESPVQFIGPHWNPGANGRYYCTHPPGLGVVLAAPYALLGYRAATWVNPVLASMSLLLVFLLCRPWTGPLWALLAAILAALNPMANEHALFGDAHIAVQFFLLGALFCLMQMANRPSLAWACAAGLLAGAIPSLRYAETLFLCVLGLFVVLWALSGRLALRSALAFGIGAALPLVALLVRNHMAYGGFWKTGYVATGEQTAFTCAALVQHAPAYVWKLLAEGLGVLFPLGLAGIVTLLAERDTRRQGLLLAGIVVPVTLLYPAYHWRPDPQAMRFLIPTFPLYTLAAVWLLSRRIKGRRPAQCATVGLLLVTTAWGAPRSHMALRHLCRDNGVLAGVTARLEEHVPFGSVVIAGIGVQQHLDYVGRWKLADAGLMNPRTNAQGRSGGPARPTHDSLGNLDPHSQAAWEAFVSAARQWAGQRGLVFLLAKPQEGLEWERRLPAGTTLVVVERISLPKGQMPPRAHSFGEEPSDAPSRPGPNAIFDLQLDGEPLLLFELRGQGLSGQPGRSGYPFGQGRSGGRMVSAVAARLAGHKPATQQIEHLRYAGWRTNTGEISGLSRQHGSLTLSFWTMAHQGMAC